MTNGFRCGDQDRSTSSSCTSPRGYESNWKRKEKFWRHAHQFVTLSLVLERTGHIELVLQSQGKSPPTSVVTRRRRRLIPLNCGCVCVCVGLKRIAQSKNMFLKCLDGIRGEKSVFIRRKLSCYYKRGDNGQRRSFIAHSDNKWEETGKGVNCWVIRN